ncbi:MAG TPA: cation transporting ATPase C-terminal domain-containing protein [Streptosporangiaceae bacterium]|jgi:cation-transporting ATPase F
MRWNTLLATIPLEFSAGWQARLGVFRARPLRTLPQSVTDPLTWTLLVAAGGVALLGDVRTAGVILAVIVAKAVVVRAFRRRAERTLSAAGLPVAVRTPLVRRMTRLGNALTIAVCVLAGAMFVAGLVRGQSTAYLLTACVAVVAAAPTRELPSMVTCTLAAGAARMARRGAVIRRLSAVEKAGRTTVICTNKAGSLTENQVTVTAVVAGGRGYELSGAGYSPTGEVRAAGAPLSLGENVALDLCLEAGLACNDAQVLEEDGRWRVVGDPTEGALLTSAAKLGIAKAPPRVATLSHAADRRFMATLHRDRGDEPGIVYVKGSVERVLYLCHVRLDEEGRYRALDGDAIRAAAGAFGRRGLRVVALARAQVAPQVNTLTEGTLPPMVFLGLQAMHDPIRPRTSEAVRTCEDAGIAVKMVTGDDATTARATAAWVGLAGATVMTGADLSGYSAATLPDAVARTAVFARVSPEEKLLLVRILRDRGQCVAMTSKSADDLPALHAADVGFDIRSAPPSTPSADLGIEDTQPMWKSAGVTLTGGDFASITAAIEEGRGALDHLAKSIEWALPATLGPGLVLTTAMLIGTALPIQPIQVLWLSLLTAIVLVVTGASGTWAPGVMRQPPPARPLLVPRRTGRTLFVTVVLLGGAFALFTWEHTHGATAAEASTAAVNVLVLMLAAHLLGARRARDRVPPGMDLDVDGNRSPLVALGALTLLALQPAFTYAPPLNDLFGSAPLDGSVWVRIVAVAAVGYGLVEAVRRLRPRRVTARLSRLR